MNFAENFTKRIQESAEKAASAAKNFKGFDEMADEDEYIHSPDLNISKQSGRWQQQQQQQQQSAQNSVHARTEALNSIISHDTADNGSSWSLLDRPQQDAAKSRGIASSPRSLSPPRRSKKPPPLRSEEATTFASNPASSAPLKSPQKPNPWLSVVSDTLEGSSGTRRTNSSLGGCESDNISLEKSEWQQSSEEEISDDENDPILSQIRASKRRLPSKAHKGKSRREQGQEKKSYRFFDSLEQREAMNGQSLSASEFSQNALEIETQPDLTSPQNGNNPMPSLKSWMMSPFQRNAQNDPSSIVNKAKLFLKRGPLSRKEPTMHQETPSGSDQEEFQVLNSNSLLGEDELAALAQYKEQESFCSFRYLCKLARKHPREAFIVFTFFLGVFVYFYSRRKSNEDDVQR